MLRLGSKRVHEPALILGPSWEGFSRLKTGPAGQIWRIRGSEPGLRGTDQIPWDRAGPHGENQGLQGHLRLDRGGGVGATPLGVSKRSVVELSRKDQQIALAEYRRLVVLFLVLGQYLTQLWQVKGQIFGNSVIFQLYESTSAKLSIVAA